MLLDSYCTGYFKSFCDKILLTLFNSSFKTKVCSLRSEIYLSFKKSWEDIIFIY